MKSNEKNKNDSLLAVVFCLILVLYTGSVFNKTGNIKLLFGEIVCLFLLLSTTRTYFKIVNAEKKKRIKKKKKKPITKITKKFKKNFRKVNKKYKQPVEVPDLKSSYIQSAWDEINKI